MTVFINILKKAALYLFVCAVTILPLKPNEANAATLLLERFDKLSSSIAADSATHQIGFTMTDLTNPVGSVTIEFCSNTPIPEDTCTLPTGLSVLGATLSNQTGETGFSIHANTTATRLVMTRTPVNPTGVPSVYDFSNVTNPTNNGSYFLRLRTFSSTDGTGVEIQNGGIVIYINSAVSVSGEVAPYLTFCVAVSITSFDCSSANNFFIDFGFFDTGSPSHATSQFIAASNAVSGYSITVSGTTLTSGLNTIPELTTPSGSIPGTSQFGMNLRQNTVPANGSDPVGPGTATPTADYNTPNQFTYINGDIIASVTHSDDIRKFTVNYITNISPAQAGGVYATTITYICLANF